jgi:hypothetical protein
MSQSDSHNLPPCPLSPECLRFIDELDTSGRQPRIELVLSQDDERDARLLAQLRSHVPACPTCTATLAQARRTRQQQRSMLRDLLADSEEAVPSTVASIMQAIASEAKTLPEGTNHHQDIHAIPTLQLGEPNIISLQEQRRQRQRRNAVEEDTSSRQPRTALINIFSLAMVAVIILSALAIFSQFITATPPPPLSTKKQSAQTPVLPAGWNSAAIGLSYPGSNSSPGRITIANYDPASGQSALLVSFPLPANAQLDTVSHDGLKLLYQYSQNGRTYYSIAPSTSANSFYSLSSSDAGNAIWLDNRSALIASKNSGVIQVDTQTGNAKPVLPNVKGVQLLIYRAPYLYFIANGGTNLVPGALYRVNIAGGSVRQVAAPALPGSTFWISPDGTALFFQNDGSQGEQGIYVVQSDSTNSSLLRAGNAIPIGYAADNALMLLQEVNGQFQVVKLGATPQQHETVVMTAAAPGAISLCDPNEQNGGTAICNNNVALSPYGYGLLLHAYYPDGSSQILYDDLTNGKSHVLVALGKQNIGVQLPGWDQLPVPGSIPPTSTPSPSQSWNGAEHTSTHKKNTTENALSQGHSP